MAFTWVLPLAMVIQRGESLSTADHVRRILAVRGDVAERGSLAIRSDTQRLTMAVVGTTVVVGVLILVVLLVALCLYRKQLAHLLRRRSTERSTAPGQLHRRNRVTRRPARSRENPHRRPVQSIWKLSSKKGGIREGYAGVRTQDMLTDSLAMSVDHQSRAMELPSERRPKPQVGVLARLLRIHKLKPVHQDEEDVRTHDMLTDLPIYSPEYRSSPPVAQIAYPAATLGLPEVEEIRPDMQHLLESRWHPPVALPRLMTQPAELCGSDEARAETLVYPVYPAQQPSRWSTSPHYPEQMYDVAHINPDVFAPSPESPSNQQRMSCQIMINDAMAARVPQTYTGYYYEQQALYMEKRTAPDWAIDGGHEWPTGNGRSN